MLDDLVFYLTNHTSHLTPQNPEPSPTIFAKKIASSHYFSLATLLWGQVSLIQWNMSRKDLTSIASLDNTFIQALERRISEYSADLENLMLLFGIPLESPLPRHLFTTTITAGTCPCWEG